MTGPPAATVVIPTYNRWATLQACLEALACPPPGAEPRETFEVIVVDDGSTVEGSVENAGWPFELTVLRQPNRGPAAARNRGLAHASAPLTVFINDDTIVAPGAIARHVNLQREKRETREPIMVLGRFDFVPDFAATPLGHMLSVGSHLFQYEMLRSGDLADYHFAYTCNLSVPTDAARAAGFDETFTGPAGEDIDFGLRLQNDGFTVLFDGAIGAHHDHHMTVTSLARTFSLRGEGAVTFALKHHRRTADTRRMAAALQEADRDRQTMNAAIDDAAANLERLLDAVGPGQSPPRAAWEELARLSSAASVRGALSHADWRQLAA